MEKEYLSVKDVADLLDVTVDTVQEWIRQRKLIAYKIGREYRIKREDFNKFMQERRTDQPSKD